MTEIFLFLWTLLIRCCFTRFYVWLGIGDIRAYALVCIIGTRSSMRKRQRQFYASIRLKETLIVQLIESAGSTSLLYITISWWTETIHHITRTYFGVQSNFGASEHVVYSQRAISSTEFAVIACYYTRSLSGIANHEIATLFLFSPAITDGAILLRF